jgi:apolipoprotein N-acyltransferase
MTPGAEAEVLGSKTGARLGAMLCYEDMVPVASREMVHGGANVLVSLINGSAFESPHTLKQHRLLAQLRALECRRYFLRCAATGETCVISPLGEIVDRIPLQQDGVLKSEVALLERTTVYSHAPWLGPSLCLLGLTAMSVFRFRFPVRRQCLEDRA